MHRLQFVPNATAQLISPPVIGTTQQYCSAYAGLEFLNRLCSGWCCHVSLPPPGYLASELLHISDLNVEHTSAIARQCSSLHKPTTTGNMHSWWLPHLFGTVCWRQYIHCHHCQFSAEDWIQLILANEHFHYTDYCVTLILLLHVLDPSLRTSGS